MTSRERVSRTLNHKTADRIPCHMNAATWKKRELQKALGVETDRELLDALHIDTFDIRGIDIRDGIMPRYTGPEHATLSAEWAGNILSLWSIEEEVTETPYGNMYSQKNYPLREAESIGDLRKFMWPQPDWFDYSDLRPRIEPWADRSIIASGASVWQHPSYLRGLDNLMVDMLTEPALADYLFDRVTEFYRAFYQEIFEAAGDLIDSLALADDLGMQSGLMISPELFEKHVAPRIAAFAELAHGYNAKLILHSDGNIRSLIPKLIDLGVDVLDPLQPEAEGMDLAEIKRLYGKDLVLRGGISTQSTLAHGNPEEVAAEVRRVMDILGEGGGYICSPGHPVLQADLPVENIIAMYETAHGYGVVEGLGAGGSSERGER